MRVLDLTVASFKVVLYAEIHSRTLHNSIPTVWDKLTSLDFPMLLSMEARHALVRWTHKLEVG